MDKIIINGLRIFGYHGVNPEEKRDGQNFILDVTISKNLKKSGSTDDLNDTVSYSKVIKTINKAFNKEKYDLIEKAAQSVAESILHCYDVDEVKVLLKKPEAPIKADFNYVAVEITRKRCDTNE